MTTLWYGIPSGFGLTFSLDLMVGVSVFVDLMEKFLVEWYGGDALCKTVRFYQATASYGSTYALVAMSIDRFDSVARPLQTMGKGD